MTAVHSLITLGIGPSSSLMRVMTLGLDGDGAAPPVVVTPPATQRRGAMYPGGWVPDRLYTPPKKKISKKKLEALKELYEEAREVIPRPLQAGLIPAGIIHGYRASVGLPAPAAIDFEALARSIKTIRVLIAAVKAAIAEEEKRKKRRAEEERLLMMLAEIL